MFLLGNWLMASEYGLMCPHICPESRSTSNANCVVCIWQLKVMDSIWCTRWSLHSVWPCDIVWYIFLRCWS